MKTVSFTVPGAPVAKERARRGRGGNFYTPARTRSYEEAVAWACQKWSGTLTEGPLRLVAYFHTRAKGDLSNFVKSLEDGITKGGVWRDDAQVRESLAMIVPPDGEEFTSVSIEEISTR